MTTKIPDAQYQPSRPVTNIDIGDTQIIPSEPLVIQIWSTNSTVTPSDAPEVAIVALETAKSVGTQTSPLRNAVTPENNLLFASGLTIDPDLANIFCPPDEVIPARRKRPLRQISKARVMTSQKVYDDILSQKADLDARNARIDERVALQGRGQNRETGVVTRSNRGGKRGRGGRANTGGWARQPTDRQTHVTDDIADLVFVGHTFYK